MLHALGVMQCGVVNVYNIALRTLLTVRRATIL